MVAKGVWHERECLTCGAPISVPDRKIKAGRGKYCSRSCGAKATGRRHGHSSHSGQSPTYNSWATMIQRCTNPKHPKYPSYGAAGITVDERWRDFAAFLADMGDRPDGHSLDRIDGEKGYEPGNCRWATPRQQMANLKTNSVVTYNGEAVLLVELALALGVDKSTLRYRIRMGWPEDQWGAIAHGHRVTRLPAPPSKDAAPPLCD